MKEIYCTYFDHNYLSRATLMIESLRRYDQSPIYVLALSELCETVLRDLALPNVEIIPLGDAGGGLSRTRSAQAVAQD